MHQHGEEIIASGYEHVVEITNYHVGDKFITPGRDFIVDGLDFELETESVDPYYDAVHHYKGFECKWTIQDGELQGLGIFVFFKNATGANICKHDFKRTENGDYPHPDGYYTQTDMLNES